jgi:hypothetical protein
MAAPSCGSVSVRGSAGSGSGSVAVARLHAQWACGHFGATLDVAVAVAGVAVAQNGRMC